MPKIQLVLTDMDDTLAPHMSHNISARVREAVLEVERSGVKIVPVTGRAYTHAKDTLLVLGVTGLGVFDGGATVVDIETGEVVWKRWIDASKVQEIVRVTREHYVDGFISSTYEMLPLKDIDVDVVAEEAPCVFVMRYDYDTESTTRGVASLADVEGVTIYPSKGINPVTGQNGAGVQITHIDANKYEGVRALLDIVGVDQAHTLAIGDGDNDISLFESACVKVAMGNATDALKREANHIVGTLDEDGFAEAMQKFVLGSVR